MMMVFQTNGRFVCMPSWGFLFIGTTGTMV